MRPLIERDVLAAYRMTAPAAVELINAGKEVMPQLFFLQMSKTQPGVLAKMKVFDPAVVLAAHGSSEGKRLLMHMIKAVLGTPGEWQSVGLHAMLGRDGFTAHLAVHISEAWVVERSAALAKDDAFAPSEQPDRAEVLLISVHERDHSYMHRLPIKSAGANRSCELLPWAPHDDGRVYGGNLSIQQEPLE